MGQKFWGSLLDGKELHCEEGTKALPVTTKKGQAASAVGEGAC